MKTTITKQDIELSEKLRKACLEKGITEPRFVAQDADGEWWHFYTVPKIDKGLWDCYTTNCRRLLKSEPNENWHLTLMEWNPNAGVPLADILKNTCEHCGKIL